LLRRNLCRINGGLAPTLRDDSTVSESPTPVVPSNSVPRPASISWEACLGGGIAVVAAVIVWAITNARYPYFTVPEEYSFGMSPPPEVVIAYLKQKSRVDTLNAMITLGIGGGLMGAGLAAVARGCCTLPLRLAAGTIWGGFWGAATGYVAVMAFAALLPRTSIASLADTGKAQAVVFALLGLGLGLLYGGFSRSPRGLIVAAITGAFVGGIGGGLYAILSGLIAPTQSTQEMIPRDWTARLLWLLVPFTAIGFLLPTFSQQTPAVSSLRE
jgi:hypothetical protein